MSDERTRSKESGEREPVTVMLPTELVSTLRQFCKDYKVMPERVVERALVEYFREGDMSH
ncbi:MAG: hypothetical protein M0Z38_07250 [Deltaproteobacteria bacterium]|nr:hypothetical protein [Deltaproteobacteria bacterium]